MAGTERQRRRRKRGEILQADGDVNSGTSHVSNTSTSNNVGISTISPPSEVSHTDNAADSSEDHSGDGSTSSGSGSSGGPTKSARLTKKRLIPQQHVGPARVVTADAPAKGAESDDGYAVGIDLEGGGGDSYGDFGDLGGGSATASPDRMMTSGPASPRGPPRQSPSPTQPPKNSGSIGTEASADTTAAETADITMEDAHSFVTSTVSSPTRPIGASRRVQTARPRHGADDSSCAMDAEAATDSTSLVGPPASRSAPAGLSDRPRLPTHGDERSQDPPETKSSTSDDGSSDQASIRSPSGRRRLRRQLEAVEKERRAEEGQAKKRKLPLPPKSPEPPEPIFPAQQLEENLLQTPRKETVLRSLSEVLVRRSLTMINLSQRGLTSDDAPLIKAALLQNPHLTAVKLSYNNLGDVGAAIIASGIGQQMSTEEAAVASASSQISRYKHHASLALLDVGFNGIGDSGCASLSTVAVAGNSKLGTLYLSGNNIRGPGAMALATAIAKGGCGLSRLHLSANLIGILGARGISVAIAEAEARRQQIDAAKAAAEAAAAAAGTTLGTAFPKLQSMEELHVGGVNMGPTGCLAISNMVLTNQSLRVLSLSNNGINDRDLALFSQSISRNKNVPLEKIQFSFNRLTCSGVESLMNAIWGSPILKEVRLDNNHIKDRGAQLAAVTLTSVNLKVLDMGFNRISTVGIKAIMKSLSENTSLESLVLSGNPLDVNASKAVSYALAYNRTLKGFHVDNCSVGYAAQRHIAAGIVSNSGLSLQAITGFRLGSMAVTLGLPPPLDKWSNEQTLKFIRMMWEQKRREELEVANSNDDDDDDESNMDQDENVKSRYSKIGKPGPADPTLVVSAAKSAFEAMSDGEGEDLLADPVPPRERLDSCPLVVHDAVMLERSPSGNVRAPAIDATRERRLSDEVTPLRRMMSTSPGVPGSSAKREDDLSLDPERRKKLEEWLGQHVTSLTELANLPFNDADLWKLHQYFFSPVGTSIFKKSTDGPQIPSSKDSEAKLSPTKSSNPTPKKAGGLTRKLSFRHLGDAEATTDIPGSRRRSLEMVDGVGSGDDGDGAPATKRARSNKPRIEFYPRVKTALDTLRYQTNQNQVLVKLRQLKYVEGAMFQGRSLHCSVELNPGGFATADVEAVLEML